MLNVSLRRLSILLAMTASGLIPSSASADLPGIVLEQPGTRRALIFCGHPGDDAHRQLYADTVDQLTQAMNRHAGFDKRAMTVLFGSDVMLSDGRAAPGSASAACTRETMEQAVKSLRKKLKPQDSLWVILIGHSYFDARHSWFNVPGKDIHEEDFAEMFRDIACRELVFWVTLPASGFYTKPLAERGRVVISATEPDRETNETTFPHVLADVLAVPPTEPDADGDGQVSVFDVYVHTVRTVAQRYQDDNALSTEHAQLEDNGDGRGSEAHLDYLPEELGGRLEDGKPARQRADNSDGSRAARLIVPLPANAVHATEPPAEEPED